MKGAEKIWNWLCPILRISTLFVEPSPSRFLPSSLPSLTTCWTSPYAGNDEGSCNSMDFSTISKISQAILNCQTENSCPQNMDFRQVIKELNISISMSNSDENIPFQIFCPSSKTSKCNIFCEGCRNMNIFEDGGYHNDALQLKLSEDAYNMAQTRVYTLTTFVDFFL